MARLGRSHPQQGQAGTFVTGQGSSTMRRVGPRAPQRVLPLPTQQMQTVFVLCVADSRVRSERRRFPKQWLEGNTTTETGFSTTGVRGSFERALGPDPPAVIRALPPQWLQTVKVTLAAHYRRVTEKRRFPPQSDEPAVIKTSGSGGQTLGAFERAIGPDPPALILPLPSLAMMTLTIRLVSRPTVYETIRRRHAVRSILRVPTKVLPVPTQRMQTVSVSLQAIAERILALRKQPHWKLSSLVVFAQPPPVATTLSVTLAAVATRVRSPRHTLASLAEPIVLQVFAGPSVTLIRTRPRPTSKVLGEPTVIRVPSVEQQEQTILVRLARIRPPHVGVALRKPTVLQVFSGPETAITHTRPRDTIARVFPPTVVRVPAVEQQEDTVRVTLTRTRPRPTIGTKLRQPLTLQVFAGPRVTCNALKHRVEPRRRALSKLSAPAFYPQTSEIGVTLTRTRPRPTTRYLAAPTTLRVFSGPKVTLVQARPRPTTKQLRKPTVLRVPSVEQQEDTIHVSLVRTRPRPTTRKLSAPIVITINPPVVTTLTVAMAGRTRLETQRHAPHSKLYPPTQVIPLPGLRAQTVSVKLVRTRPRHTSAVLLAVPAPAAPFARPIDVTLAPARRPYPHSHLSAPVVLRVFFGPMVSVVRTRPRPTAHMLGGPTVLRVFAAARAPLVRTRPRHTIERLAPPVVVTPPPSQREQTIQVKLAGRTRLEALRRIPRSKLSPPAVVTPPPRLAVLTIRVVLVALQNALWPNRRRPHPRLGAPAAIKPQHLYFSVGSPVSAWATGRMDSSGLDFSVYPPASGWTTGRLSVDIVSDNSDDDWSVGSPL